VQEVRLELLTTRFRQFRIDLGDKSIDCDLLIHKQLYYRLQEM